MTGSLVAPIQAKACDLHHSRQNYWLLADGDDILSKHRPAADAEPRSIQRCQRQPFPFSIAKSCLISKGAPHESQDSMLNLMVLECQEAQFPNERRRLVYAPMKTMDGHVIIAPISQKNFEQMAEAMQRPDLKDVRFSTGPARVAHWI